MNTIEVIQFLRPNGQRQVITTEVSDEAFAKYQELRRLGCEVHAESLTTGEVSMTVSNGHDDIDIFVCQNGPPVIQNLEAMLKRFKKGFNPESQHHTPDIL